MLGIIFWMLIVSVFWFYLYRTWKLISSKLDLEIAELDAEITEKLHQIRVKKELIAEKQIEIASRDAEITKKLHQIRIKQIEIVLLNLKLAEIRKKGSD